VTTPLRVWAPRARRVEAELAGARHALAAEDGGWWRLPGAPPAEGVDYAFRLDGGEPLPDPRAPRLPYGACGPGRSVDHDRFAWRDAGFRAPALADAVVYELHVGTFSPAGSFVGAIPYLGALQGLGVTHVELMPVHAFPGARGWGYDPVGLFAPHEGYGGPEGLKRLVDAAHARGLAVLLDVVYNHLGPGERLSRFGPYFSERHRTPWGAAFDLDGPARDEVRRFLCDNAVAWLRDYHFDGLRLDAVHALCDGSVPPFLAQLREAVDALAARSGRSLCLIAESDLNDPRLVAPREAGGLALDAQWNDDFHHAVHALISGERRGYYADFGRIADLAKAFERAFVYDGRWSRQRGRRHGAPVRDLPGERFLAFLQNHDQVGNRALGERAGHLLEPERLKLAAAFVLLSPFVPLIFQGEEWAAGSPFLYFTDHADPELARAVREGRQREHAAQGGDPAALVDPQSREAFARSRLDWKERDREPHAGILAWYTRLLALRRAYRELRTGPLDNVRARFDEARRWLCVARGRLSLAANLASQGQRVPLHRPGGRLLLASRDGVTVAERSVDLPGFAIAVVAPAADAPDVLEGVSAGIL
jgi:maltooligosyltrehalose trehalohydrolase